MQSDNTVSLKVNGKLYKGWLSVEITSKLQTLARRFSVSATRTLDSNGDKTNGIVPGDLVEVFIGEDKVLTGYVMRKAVSYTATGINITISGASKPIDLEQCCLPDGYPTSFKNQTHLDNLQSVCKPYGINVIDEVGNTNKCDFEIKPTETIKDAIVAYLQKHSLLIGDNENGDIVIREAGSDGASPEALEVGKNILSGERVQDHSALFSEFVVLGQATNALSELPTTSNQLKAVESYSGCRKRTSVTQGPGNSSQQGLHKKAVSLRDISVGKSNILTYSVRGWRQSNGDLWQINQKIIVTDDYLGFRGDLLVSGVRLSMMSSGMTASLTLEPDESFNVYATKDDSNAKVANFDDVKAGSGSVGGTKWTS